MLLCDVDHLKEINDRYGHAGGDRALQATAELLRDRVRAGDHAARLGGDEFGILCPDTGLAAAIALAEDVRARVDALTPADTSVPAVTVSIGVACREAADASPAEMVMRADDRLYSAKRARTAVDLTSAG